jgi:hypothetical protein
MRKHNPHCGIVLRMPISAFAVLGDQDVCKEPGAREPALDRTTRCQRTLTASQPVIGLPIQKLLDG